MDMGVWDACASDGEEQQTLGMQSMARIYESS
jgi:hypothetical protein